MLARIHTFSLEGLDTRPVIVEVDVRQGLPGFTVVGLGDAAVREARERVRGALLNSGLEFPLRRIVANLAPAHARKNGSGFDLAIACGVLAATGQVPADRLAELAVFGELSLSGELRGARGTLAVAQAAAATGLRGLVLAPERAGEGALVDGLQVCALHDLREVVELLRGAEPPPLPEERRATRAPGRAGSGEGPDLRDVRGQREPVEALRVAAAGGHNLLLSGPPGTGKTMLARRLPSILPPLTRSEAIEVTRIASTSGAAVDGLAEERPFRAPHHTISPAGLVGGGPWPAPGEVTLAHHGVLFLDELSEFSRLALEALRQPLEDGRVAIVRGQQTAVFPARFMLVAATNPCPCGFAGDEDEERCTCGEAELARHARRLSGPLLDRIDIVAHVRRPPAGTLGAGPGTDSATVRAQVVEARERQAARLAGTGTASNAQMTAADLRRCARLDTAAEATLATAYERSRLSARGHERIVRVARTLADLAGSDRIHAVHVHRALHLRRQDQSLREAA